MRFIALIMFLTAAFAPEAFSEMLTWTLKSGKKAQAELLDVSLDSASFRFENGKEKTIPINKLSEDDIKKIFSQIKFPRYSRNRSWTLNAGETKKLEARLQNYNGREASLKMSNGKLVNVKTSMLSKEDLAYLAQYRREHLNRYSGRSSTGLSGNSKKLNAPEPLRTWTIIEPPQRIYGKIEMWDGDNICIKLRRENKTETFPMASFAARDKKYLSAVLSRTLVIYKRNLARAAKQEEVRKARELAAAKQAEIREARKKEADEKAKELASRNKAPKEEPKSDSAKNVAKQSAPAIPQNFAMKKTPIVINQPEPPPRKEYSAAQKTAFAVRLVLGTIILVILNTIFAAVCLWVAKCITKCETSFLVLLLTSVVAALLSLIPVVGIFIAAPIQLIMIMLISKTRFIDTFFMIIVANFIYIIVSMALIARIMSYM